MSLYLCVMDQSKDEEFDGFEVGPYSYFGAIRDLVAKIIPDAEARFPLLMQQATATVIGELRTFRSFARSARNSPSF